MNTWIRSVVVALCVAPSAAVGEEREFESEPVFVPHQYTAILDLQTDRWVLTPLEGRDTEVRVDPESCPNPPDLPRGVWYWQAQGPDAQRLVAPSSVASQTTMQSSVAVVRCGSASGAQALAVPGDVLEWLRERGGAVYVRP